MWIQNQRRYRTFLIVLVYLIVVTMGIRRGGSQFVPREREFFYSLMLALALTRVCIVDCRVVGRPLSIFSYWLVFMLYGIAVPNCIIRARGIRGLGIVAAHFVGIILVFGVSLVVTGLLCGTF